VHLYLVYLMFSGTKTANKTDKEFKMQIGKHLGKHLTMKLSTSDLPVSEWYVVPQTSTRSAVRVRRIVASLVVVVLLVCCICAVLGYNWAVSSVRSVGHNPWFGFVMP